MTDEMMNLRSLVEKSADVDLPREMIGFTTRAGGRPEDGRGLWREERASACPAQRLSRAGLGDTGRDRGTAHPEASYRHLFPKLYRAASQGREGSDGRHSGRLYPGRFDPLGRRPSQGDGHERHLQEPAAPALDNGQCYVAYDLGEWLEKDKIDQVHGAPGHP